MGENARRQTLQVNELLDERECGRDHGLRGDKLHSLQSLIWAAEAELTVARIAKMYIIL